MILTNIKNHIGINIKIVMTDNVSHAFDLLLIDVRVPRQKAIVSYLIEIFQ